MEWIFRYQTFTIQLDLYHSQTPCHTTSRLGINVSCVLCIASGPSNKSLDLVSMARADSSDIERYFSQPTAWVNRAKYHCTVVQTCLDNRLCLGITVCEYSTPAQRYVRFLTMHRARIGQSYDRISWTPGINPGWAPLHIFANFLLKPAYEVMKEALQ